MPGFAVRWPVDFASPNGARGCVVAYFGKHHAAVDRCADAHKNSFTIADVALLHVERWAAPQGVVLPVNVAAHFERMLARPSVHKVRDLWDER